MKEMEDKMENQPMLKIFMNEPFATDHELAQASLKESLAALTAAQKSLMNETFKEGDHGF